MGKDKIKSKHILTRDDLVAYLETLVLGIKQGTLILDNEERPLLLRPSNAIEAEVKIKQKSDREKLELKLSWSPNRLQPLTTTGPDDTSTALGLEAKKK